MAKEKANALLKSGVSLWLDSLSREMIESGWLKTKIDEWSLRGQTSNPSIFEQAVSKGTAYEAVIAQGAKKGSNKETLCWDLMIEDVQLACDHFLDLYKETDGGDGYVSLELDPTKANETEGSISQAHEIWKRVDRPNLMIKVPGTKEGLPVIEELTASGYNVNITLLFSVEIYREVMDRYMKGLERRVADGKPIDSISSVASFFISRVDSEVDKQLDNLGGDKALALKGKIAVANARVAYAAYQEVLESSDRFAKLKAKGGRLQRPLWASTSTKDPAYPDTLYVDELIGPNCINTVPINTLEAALDHGKTEVSLTKENEKLAREQLKSLKDLGIELFEITNVLLVEEGVEKFAQSYNSLLATLDEALKKTASTSASS